MRYFQKDADSSTTQNFRVLSLLLFVFSLMTVYFLKIIQSFIPIGQEVFLQLVNKIDITK